ncbi:MAG: VWA domain-containing protein [Bryobacterales bacterium]|nr:VWA domain-containing protein [Bryobacterales bacterium]
MVAARQLLAFALLALPSFAQQARLSVSAFDEKTGEPIANLTAANFLVRDGDTQLRVDAVEHSEKVLDLMLVVDTSMVGQAIRPLVMPMIDAAAEGDQTALVGYDQSATLLQDFTSSKDLLRKGMLSARYGGNPRGIDALFAVLDGGFEFASGRRVAVLLSAGAEGSSRTAPGDIYALARRRGVQIFCVYAEGADAGAYERLAENTGGAYFHVKKLDLKPADLANLVYANVRGSYELTVSGVYTLGSKIKVEIVNPPADVKKPVATALVLE